MNPCEEASGSRSGFKFTHYNCIGFDLDNTLARYKVGEVIDLEYKIMANFLTARGYSKEHLLKPLDHSFLLKGLIVDDDHGNVLRIDPSGEIIMASHGTRMLSQEEIAKVYKNKHWEGTDEFISDPIKYWFSNRMATLIDYYDIGVSALFARAVDSIDEVKGQQMGYKIWPDIIEAMIYMFSRKHCKQFIGEYFPALLTEPEKYYYKCSDVLISWMKKLKSDGILLFLITGSNADFAIHTATNTIGPNWREFFDIVICYARKPGFFTLRRPFYKIVDGEEGECITSIDQLTRGGIYAQGNWTDLCTFLGKFSTVPNPRFVYVGDNLVQDIYTPNMYNKCDTVAICEELEAEGHRGHQHWHPDAQFLVSTVWGSYFQGTNWHEMMDKHSKLCVPSVEYVAKFPIDHTFEKKL